MKIVNADSLRNMLIKAGKDPYDSIEEKDLLALGFKPIKAWVGDDGCLVVFEINGGLHNIGVAFWHI